MIGFLVCMITLFLAAGMRDISGNAVLTLQFGARGLFQVTIVTGVMVALAEWFFQKMKKTLLVLFIIFAVCAACLGWIFAQSIIHF